MPPDWAAHDCGACDVIRWSAKQIAKLRNPGIKTQRPSAVRSCVGVLDVEYRILLIENPTGRGEAPSARGAGKLWVLLPQAAGRPGIRTQGIIALWEIATPKPSSVEFPTINEKGAEVEATGRLGLIGAGEALDTHETRLQALAREVHAEHLIGLVKRGHLGPSLAVK